MCQATLRGIFAPEECFEFGQHYIGLTSAVISIEIANPYGVAVTVSSVVASAGFEVLDFDASVGVGEDFQADVTFSPSAAGAVEGALTFTTSAGTIIQPLCATGVCADFGAVALGIDSALLTIGFPNYGDDTMNVSAITPSNPNVVVSDACTVILTNEICNFGLTWTPTVDGESPGTVDVVTDDGTFTIELCGNAVQIPGGFLIVESVTPESDTPVGLSVAPCACGATFGMFVGGVTGTFSVSDTITSVAGWSGTVLYWHAGSGFLAMSIVVCSPLPAIGDALTGPSGSGALTGVFEADRMGVMNHAANDQDNFHFTVRNIGGVAVTTATAQKLGTLPTGFNNAIAYAGGPANNDPFASVQVINAGATTTFQHVFSSSAFVAGITVTGSTIITSNAINDTLTMCLRGVNGTPTIRIEPLLFDFGETCVDAGCGVGVQFEIFNEGNGTLFISSCVITSEFNNGCGAYECSSYEIAPGSSCFALAVFNPLTSGGVGGALNVGSNAGGASAILLGIGHDCEPE